MVKFVAGWLAGSLFVLPVLAQSNQAEELAPPPAAAAGEAAAKDAAAKEAPATARKVSPHRQQRMAHKAQNYYAGVWGVDKLQVRQTASGNLIRFTYRVTDPALAKPLADRNATPYLLGQRSRALLQVPVMDKVGPLRQAQGLTAGQQYWMVFSNKGNLVKPGDRVNVMIGAFHADGLMVE